MKTKNKGVKHETYPCRKCPEPMKAGEQYYATAACRRSPNDRKLAS